MCVTICPTILGAVNGIPCFRDLESLPSSISSSLAVSPTSSSSTTKTSLPSSSSSWTNKDSVSYFNICGEGREEGREKINERKEGRMKYREMLMYWSLYLSFRLLLFPFLPPNIYHYNMLSQNDIYFIPLTLYYLTLRR